MKSGQRSEGATYTVFSFTRKITQSIGGAATAWALAIAGYIAATKSVPIPVQPDAALVVIKAVIGLVPAAAPIVAMVVFAKYPFNDPLFQQVRDENEARKAALDGVVLPEANTGH